MKYIDNFLNQITMYRLTLYALFAYIAIAFIESIFHLLPFDPIYFAYGFFIIVILSHYANMLLAKFFKAPANVESVYITALILVLLISPARSFGDRQFLIFAFFASVLAQASKYIFAVNKKHIFNPAAIALVITGIFLGFSPSWWIGTAAMLPAVLVGGFLIVRKLQRADLAWSFIIVAFVAIIVGRLTTAGVFDYLGRITFDTPLFFFATVMLTEPITAPPTRFLRIVYGALTGFLFAPFVHIGMLYWSPELALVCGNLFSYIVSPKIKAMLTLKRKVQLTPTVYDFAFASDKKFSWKPGQYLEWTLPPEQSDDRGNRRYFTLASSPTEKEIHLAVKFAEHSSSFKSALGSLSVGSMIVASGLSGEFTLPKNKKEKLVFLAGGIGVTPFRSMIKYLIDTGQMCDIVFVYSNPTAADIAYKDIFHEARTKLGMKVFYMITKEAPPAGEEYVSGRMTGELIRKQIPDYLERHFYISGSHEMVETFKKELSAIRVPKIHIKTDFFPGFV